ncbi:hypothetical protein [Mucilaginibacter sp. UYCu711]|uniref:hypothetical protein n=1 Tax=Mucilaginibacter sp. UYCu711 TaxID=3156339 RepID=UPI003D23C171
MPKSKLILIAAFIIYAISAVFNNGYYYYDEHYQIIEFADLKTGHNTPDDLPWEYNAKIRPAAQPAMAYVFLSLMRMIHINDPYILMIILRLCTGIVALLIITYFIKKTAHLINPDFRTWYSLLSYFLWFIPFVNVRFSSESCAGLAFILSIALLYSDIKFRYLLIGCLLGVSFLFRFQTAFMSLGFILWLIFIHKILLKDLLKVLLGGSLILLLGIGIDYWFYGSFTLTFYNYYVANVIHNVASNYGVYPWYFYFLNSTIDAFTPIGILIWLCIINLFISHNKNFICWVILPFLLIHMMTPHKETRFLFPLVNVLPLAIVLSLQDLSKFSFFNKRRLIYYVSSVLVIINLVALVITMLSPADSKGRLNIMQTIHTQYKNDKVKLWYVDMRNPYMPILINQNFYRDENVSAEPLDVTLLNNFNNGVTNLILIKTTDIANYQHLLAPYQIKKIKSGIPEWIQKIKTTTGYVDNSLTLFAVTWR